MLIAVSKKQSIANIQAAVMAGQIHFGENYVQELVSKYQQFPNSINWHFIGHLQTNKVKLIAPFVSMIHSVDSFKLLQEINKWALKFHRVIPVLLELYIAKEDSKSGFSIGELEELFKSEELFNLTGISISGLMGMASFTNDENQIRGEFQVLKKTFDSIKQTYHSRLPSFKHISMGMSSDYGIAIDEGSTMVRIGTSIFGQRQ